MEEVLLVRYGEIGLKGDNRADFEEALVRHLKHVIGLYPDARIQRTRGRIYIKGVPASKAVLERLSRVPGVVALSPAVQVSSDIAEIRAAATSMARQAASELARTAFPGPAAPLSPVAHDGGQPKRQPITFKVDSRRPDKTFPVMSPELNRVLGGAILEGCPDLSVDVHDPAFTLKVEVRETGTYLYWDEVAGPGGLPLGTSGRGLLLLSGGIDSPVAGYMAMKRGVAVDALHFWSFPITGERSRDKVVRLAGILRDFNPQLRLYIAHFTDVQTAIIQKCPEKFRVIIMRRMMMRIASRLAEKTGALSIFTGENVGQVASQTLESLAAIEDAAAIPVLRPLICFNKVDTINLAREIGTYETSVLPYEDCCTVFVPKHPVTKPRLEEVREAESSLDVDALVEDCLRKIEETP